MSKKHKNIFFMEIFNEILKVNDNDIAILFDKKGNIWFGLRDIIKSLGYINIENAITKIKVMVRRSHLKRNIYPPENASSSST